MFVCTDSAVIVWTPAAVAIQGQLYLTHDPQTSLHTYVAVGFSLNIGGYVDLNKIFYYLYTFK